MRETPAAPGTFHGTAAPGRTSCPPVNDEEGSDATTQRRADDRPPVPEAQPDLEVPAPGVTCPEPKPFGGAAAARAAATRRGDLRRLIRRERRAAMSGMPVPALLGR